MSEPFIGDIKLVGFNFAPKGWAKCHGQLLEISQNQALYSLIGTLYGGDGKSTFALPDLRGRTIIGQFDGSGLTPRRVGERGGLEGVTLTYAQMPSHTHGAISSGTATGTFKLNASTQGATDQSPTGKIPAASQTNDPDRPLPIRSYIDPSNSDTQMAENIIDIDLCNANLEIENSGGGQSFNNMQPYLVMNYVIALDGWYPCRW